jgi:hypothetical protein
MINHEPEPWSRFPAGRNALIWVPTRHRGYEVRL